MEKIEIRNFGPIKEVEIELKDVNIFIGSTSSGKSTVAKLVSIFKSGELAYGLEKFEDMLESYGIDYGLDEETYIKYTYHQLFYEFADCKMNTNIGPFNSGISFNAIYIPAERAFFSTLSQSIFGLLSKNVSLPKWLIDFGAKFEQARMEMRKFKVDFLDASYEYSDGGDYISVSNSSRIRLGQASSGLQSIIPLLLVVKHNTIQKDISDDMFVIEEPEINLYPSSQKDLIEFIFRRINFSDDKLIITTHSPYLLTAIDNLIQAGNVGFRNDTDFTTVDEIVDKQLWLNFDRVSCYYFNGGTAKSTMDSQNRSIGPSNIDDVSAELGETFDQLLALKYKNDGLR